MQKSYPKTKRESHCEKICGEIVTSKGGYAIKLTTKVGLPDRLFLLPGGVIFFVEFKRVGHKLRKLQTWWRDKLTGLGFGCHVTDSIDEFKEIMEMEIQKQCK